MKYKSHLTIPARLLPFCFLLIGAVILAGFLFYTDRSEKDFLSRTVDTQTDRPTVVLDPGHGGVDPGAISKDGLLEKDLNLAVAQKVGAFLESAGIRVIYTRTEDISLDSEQGGSRKTRDLMGRVELARKHPEALFISIHMNTLPIEKYSGLQVFYSDQNEENRALAQLTQNTVCSLFQPENNRKAKDSRGSIFILDRIPATAILIECGFLSNHNEAKNLGDPLYQSKLSYAISRSILDFVAEREKI